MTLFVIVETQTDPIKTSKILKKAKEVNVFKSKYNGFDIATTPSPKRKY